jgi:hypothetical protein
MLHPRFVILLLIVVQLCQPCQPGKLPSAVTDLLGLDLFLILIISQPHYIHRSSIHTSSFKGQHAAPASWAGAVSESARRRKLTTRAPYEF